MDADEGFILILAGAISFFVLLDQIFTRKPPLLLRKSEAFGIARIAYFLSLLYVLFVLLNFADPSVVGIYILFYFVIGFVLTHVFGLYGASAAGVRYGVDVKERNNVAAAILVGVFTLSTGLIYGSSLWGEADPDGGGEGGWWIPLGFFIVGWSVLAFSTWFYRQGEWGKVQRGLRQNRDPQEILRYALFILTTGWIIAEAVAGNFYGWIHGLSAVGAILLMIIAHEFIARFTAQNGEIQQRKMTALEALFYVVMTAVFTLFSRYILPGWV